MNIYNYAFSVRCPENGEPISYSLKVETASKILVEELKAFCVQEPSHHEDLADRIFSKFGGVQTMLALHHGVRITTIRGAL